MCSEVFFFQHLGPVSELTAFNVVTLYNRLVLFQSGLTPAKTGGY